MILSIFRRAVEVMTINILPGNCGDPVNVMPRESGASAMTARLVNDCVSYV
jgi:hypothetical protein